MAVDQFVGRPTREFRIHPSSLQHSHGTVGRYLQPIRHSLISSGDLYHAMNWTGGNLSRRSGGGTTASLSQRQKQHFAKAQNLRNGTKKRSPITWSVFGKIQVQEADLGRQYSGGSQRYRETSLPIRHDRPRYTYDSNQRSNSRHAIRHTQRAQQPIMKQEDGQNDDLYNATPPPVQKRKREGFTSANSVDDEEVDPISKKRQKLLGRGDWVGITYQRPLQMTFASPRHADNVGRRRTVTDGHQARYASRQSTLTSPYAARARQYSSRNFDTRSQRGKTDVRIHIGDRIISLGSNSSTAASKRSREHSTPWQIRNQPQVASSDVMLLENNEDLRNSQSQGANMTLFDYHNYSPKEADTSPNVPESCPILGIPFSPSLIKHPIPQSSIVSSILRSGSSLIADSTVAQVGKVIPVVPSSQVLEDEVWEAWMAPLFNDEPYHCQPGEVSDFELENRISPGISTAPAGQFRRPKSTLYLSALKAQVEDFDEVGRASIMVNPSVPGFSSTEDHVERRELARVGFKSEPEGHSQMRKVEKSLSSINTRRVGTSVPPATNITAVLETRTGHLNYPPSELTNVRNDSHAQPESKGRNEAHPDNLWRKFVFGSDETVESDHIQTMRQNDIGYPERIDPSNGGPAKFSTYTERQNESTPQCSDSDPHTHTPSTVLKAHTTSSDMPWDPPKGVASATYLSTREDNTRLHSYEQAQDSFILDPTLASNESTISGVSERSESSRAVHASSQSRASNSWDTPLSPRPKKVVLKKPKRYQGAKTAPQSSLIQDEPLHVGRALMKGSKQKESTGYFKLDRLK